MGQRSIASVSICFGLLSIPVKVYKSSNSETVKFKQITADGNFIRQKIVDSVTGIEVDSKNLLKGYEYEKNKYVNFTQEEVDALSSEKCNTATIEEFVPASTVNTTFGIEETYYISPDKGADKAYLLLSAALKKTDAMAVAKWYSRGREHLVAIAPHGQHLIMHKMFYNSEIREFDNSCASLPIHEKELELGVKLIKQGMVSKYGNSENNPHLYRDNFIDRVNEAVQKKLSGSYVVTEAKSAPAVSGSLMDLLAASVGESISATVEEKVEKKARKKKAS